MIRAIFIAMIAFVAIAQVTYTPITGLTTNNLVYSGNVTIAATSTNKMFFTFYGMDGVKNQADLPSKPLAIFVGSPGSSAQYQAILSMGPLKLQPNMTFATNPNSVTTLANIMFVDLLGSGYSFAANTADLPKTSAQYGNHLTYAINQIAGSKLGTQKCVLVGEGTFIRSLISLDDIDCLTAVVHIAPWPQFYAIGRYYGIAGVDMKLFTDSERIALDSTFVTCYNNAKSSKFVEAHNCYTQVLNFVESKTKNANLFNIQLGSNLTDNLIMAQYYFSLPSTVNKWQAPSSQLFESQSNMIYNLTYADMAKNYTQNMSLFLKDYLTVKHWIVAGDSDFLVYRKALKLWLQNELAFVESDAFKKKAMEDVIIDGVTVASQKAVKQITYTQVLKSGHYVSMDQNAVFIKLLADFLSSLSTDSISVQTKPESLLLREQIVIE